MKKLLPQTSRNPQGFTLIELLVVIAILAILATIGLAIFSNVQGKARDAKRRHDVAEITKALDVAKGVDAIVFPALADALFTPGIVPKDPTSTRNYCIFWSLTTGRVLLSDPITWTTSCAAGAATADSSARTTPANNTPAAGVAYKIRVCAALEDTTDVVCSTTQAN